MRVVAPAKVNLLLAVGATRPDGYHDVTTVLHALGLHDTITIDPAESLSLACDVDLGVAPEQNLAYRAAVVLGEALGREPLVALHITKRIPHGAGLGGGSSDAAAVIVGLATLWGVDPLDARCLAVAASLGADVPFFLQPSGCALMTARGDHVECVLPAAAGVPVVVVKPQEPVPTAAAYAAFDADPWPPAPADPLLAVLEGGGAVEKGVNVAALASELANNMVAASTSVVPAVGEVLDWLAGHPGVAGATVAGSGSAVFGLCESDDVAREIEQAAVSAGWYAVATRLADAGARVADGGA